MVLILASWPTLGQAEGTTDQPIFPQQLTARDLLTACAASSLTDFGRTRQRYCWGFISGVEEAIRLPLQVTEKKSTQTICVPTGVSSRILAKSYISYAAARDANLDRPAAQVVIEALSKTYPCSGST